MKIAPHLSSMRSATHFFWMWKCNWSCASNIYSLEVELERDYRDFWGANVWLVNGCLCIHPYRIYSMIRLELFWFQLGTHCMGATLVLLRGEYYPRVTILMCGIKDCLSTKSFSKEKKVRFITWHRTMNNRISYFFISTGMLIVS